MTTYKHQHQLYFYDASIRSWTVYKIDINGYQISEADYYPNKARLKKYNPEFKFIKHIEIF